MQTLKASFARPRTGRRMVALLLGVFLMGAGVALFDQLGFGTDPCSVLGLAVSRLIGWGYGNYLLLFNGALLLLLLCIGEIRRIGIGSIANIVLVGYSADFVNWLINCIHPLTNETMAVRLIVFVPSMIIFLIAVSLYMVVDLGVAPYDAMPMVIADCKKWHFPLVRMIWDLVVLALGWLCGGRVGLVTVVTGFCLGPVFGAIANRIRPFFED